MYRKMQGNGLRAPTWLNSSIGIIFRTILLIILIIKYNTNTSDTKTYGNKKHSNTGYFVLQFSF